MPTNTPLRSLAPAAVVALLGTLAACSYQPDATSRRSFVAIVDSTETPIHDAPPLGDPRTLARLLHAAQHDSRVLALNRHLCEAIGPRLTGSTNLDRAVDWSLAQFRAWGLAAHAEAWGTIPVGFDRGEHSGQVLLPKVTKAADGTETTTFEPARDLVLTTFSWSVGTNPQPDGTSGGPVRGPVLKEPLSAAEFDALRERLPGAWILLKSDGPVGQRAVRRLHAAAYTERQEARAKVAQGADPATLSIRQRLALAGVAGFIQNSCDERIWTGSVPDWRELAFDSIPQDVHVHVRGSDYDFINSRLYDGLDVQVEISASNTFRRGPVPVSNVVAEITGTVHPEQVVIISGHLDSWDTVGSQGCTDNATGCAVALEAARLLASSGARPDRTIRFILWTGEEQGLLGSTAYAEAHANELPNFSAVFVDDGGTNSQGGLAIIEPMRPLLAAATAPANFLFRDDATNAPLNVNIRVLDQLPKPGGSDHAPFAQRGVPGFFWDEVGRSDYPRGWHTQFDRFDMVIPVYLQQSAACSAITAYRLACAPTLLPRPPAPESNAP